MKFNKQMDSGALLIPRAAFKISSFEADEKAEIHALDSAVIVLKKQMTAMELIQAADALHRLATELTAHLAMACGECGECEDGCPFDDLEEGMLELPDYLRREACIPDGAKLCAYADDEENTVTIGIAEYDHDLRDVPPYDANTGEPAADEEDDKELPDTVTLLVSPEQAKVLAELEAEGTIHLSLVYRGDRENAGKFLAAQNEILLELYPPEPDPEEEPQKNPAETDPAADPGETTETEAPAGPEEVA